ncbi:hypothetical protein MMC11_007085 [Xylographa trunciseda]|nr:hypothetical protein [Xylographa trunciseda]
MSGFHYPTVRFLGNDDAHERGYLLLRCFETGPGTGVSLVYSLDDRRYYIRKLITPTHHYFPDPPAEVRYSNLADENPFPGAPYFPHVVEQFELNDNSWITYTVAYNGGTHQQLLDKFSSQKKAIPESFIWHYIEQCLEAYAFLHFGIVNGKRTVIDWTPIVHRDGNGDNIIFDFPSPEELSIQNENDRKIAEAFPRVILADMGMANRVDDPEKVRTHGKFDTPGVNQWEDLVLFGERIRELLNTSFDEAPPLRDVGLEKLYSQQLITAVEQFEGPPNVVWGADTAHHVPTWEWALKTLLQTAVREKREHVKAGMFESVIWAQPTPTTNMPYHLTPTDKAGLRALVKQGGYWGAVDFHFQPSKITDVSEKPECMKEDFDLSSTPKAPEYVDFYHDVKESAMRLKRAASEREKENIAYGGTSGQWTNDIKAVRGILPILKQVYRDPDDPNADASSTEEAKDDTDSSDSDSSSEDSGDDDAGSKPAGGALPNGHKAETATSPQLEGGLSTGDERANQSKKRERSPSIDTTAYGKRRKTASGRLQVRETIVKNTYITRTRDLDENGN